MRKIKLALLFTLIFLGAAQAQTNNTDSADLNSLAIEFLTNIKNGNDTNDLRAKLYALSLEDLEQGLKTDAEKLAFWINIYNGYIQVILSEHPEKYDNRSEFFKADQIPIAGRLIAFSKIEHGIIRKSQWELGLGKIRKWFPNKFERKLRVDNRDYRIHFALNCGAKDCPPVAIYDAKRLEEQLSKGTEMYLKKTSEYSKEKNEVAVTSLFSWFRGDFGSKKGVKNILKELEIIQNTDVNVTYKNYDWTLDLDNWIEL
ncbi:DUF547 domain-containing protein [Aurantibacter crassamenti]|uniref:DUF547 domain-containing protein n=1 Tax=Aurantibacter crassamenti TaxID=1837375 RepID=UPI00193A6173|nr:DUF547 domain-containing protein [Aurantibacter crassamenti]MBM1107648.1 DUF547 domain-containing protein [Aurantibacter crassamenti]